MSLFGLRRSAALSVLPPPRNPPTAYDLLHPRSPSPPHLSRPHGSLILPLSLRALFDTLSASPAHLFFLHTLSFRLPGISPDLRSYMLALLLLYFPPPARISPPSASRRPHTLSRLLRLLSISLPLLPSALILLSRPSGT